MMHGLRKGFITQLSKERHELHFELAVVKSFLLIMYDLLYSYDKYTCKYCPCIDSLSLLVYSLLAHGQIVQISWPTVIYHLSWAPGNSILTFL